MVSEIMSVTHVRLILRWNVYIVRITATSKFLDVIFSLVAWHLESWHSQLPVFGLSGWEDPQSFSPFQQPLGFGSLHVHSQLSEGNHDFVHIQHTWNGDGKRREEGRRCDVPEQFFVTESSFLPFLSVPFSLWGLHKIWLSFFVSAHHPCCDRACGRRDGDVFRVQWRNEGNLWSWRARPGHDPCAPTTSARKKFRHSNKTKSPHRNFFPQIWRFSSSGHLFPHFNFKRCPHATRTVFSVSTRPNNFPIETAAA